jgi:hypothetical protein
MNLPNKLKEFKVTMTMSGAERFVTASSYVKAAAIALEIEPTAVVKMMSPKGFFANMRYSKSTGHLHKSCRVELWNS